MKAKILVIQFRSDDAGIAAEKGTLTRILGGVSALTFKNALRGEVNWDDPKAETTLFDAVILAGSAELYFDGGHPEEHHGRVVTSKIAREARPFAQYLIAHDIPTLGICFGHQLLGHAAGAHVHHSKEHGKTGTIDVEIGEEGKHDPLFQGLPQSFPAQYAHKDVLGKLPLGAAVLACNPGKCSFAALRYAPHVYSVQFHPERSREEFIAAAKRLQDYMPDGSDVEEIFKDSKESERVLTNFASLALG